MRKITKEEFLSNEQLIDASLQYINYLAKDSEKSFRKLQSELSEITKKLEKSNSDTLVNVYEQQRQIIQDEIDKILSVFPNISEEPEIKSESTGKRGRPKANKE